MNGYDTRLSLSELLKLMLDNVDDRASETPSLTPDALKLPNRVVQLLLEREQERKLLNVLGAIGPASLSPPTHRKGIAGDRFDPAGLAWWVLCLTHTPAQRA
jgi:hypothetical protein